MALQLDGTLIHRSAERIANSFCVIPTNEGRIYIQKRPGLDNFLKVMSCYYELVIFTGVYQDLFDDDGRTANDAITNKIIDKVDPNGHITKRLFSDSCTPIAGYQLAKDLTLIGRPAEDMILLDNTRAASSL